MGTIKILDTTTVNPITIIGERAGICWGANITDKVKNYNRGLDCLRANHGRTLEFVNVEMIIDGYSARVIREWYTHIGGSPTRLQASTRYINYDNFDFVIPATIKRDTKATEIYQKFMTNVASTLQELEAVGIPREDSAMILPLGMETKIVDKRNLRNLIDMAHQRMCNRAYWEFRELFDDIRNALSNYSYEWQYIVENYFVPKCEYLGECPENHGCGMYENKQNSLAYTETYDKIGKEQF